MNSCSNDANLGYDSAGRPVILPGQRRCRHTVCLGGTGYGKSKMLEGIIYQDLLAWTQSRAGMALWDPHGSVVSNVLAFAAERGLSSLPIIPIDCRRLDWVVCFNPLRARPHVEPSTIVAGCMDAIHQAANDWELSATPRLDKWLRASLLAVFFSGGTIGDILVLLRSPEIRRSVTRAIEDDVARSVFDAANYLRESEIQTMTESLSNRAVAVLSATLLRLSLNQAGASFDFGTAMRNGSIVLISLATAGGNINEIDARTLGCLLLQDLWLAAKERGKGELNRHRPFRVYIDEASNFLTPTIAQGMAEARGFGLEFFLLAQSTTQFQASPVGQRILDAILANCYTKIIFNTQHEADLDILTPLLFRHNINPDKIKHQHYSSKVLEYRLEHHDSIHRSMSRGTAENQSRSRTQSESRTTGLSITHSEAFGESHGVQSSVSLGVSASRSRGSGSSHAESVARSAAEGTTESRASSHASQHTDSANEGENRHLGGDDTKLRKIVGYKPTSTFDAAYTDRYEEFRPLDRTIDRTASEGESDSESDTESTGHAVTRSTSNARAIQDSDSCSESESAGISESLTHGVSDTVSSNTTDGETYSESDTTGTSETRGTGHTESRSISEGTTSGPMLAPVLGKEALPPMFRSVDEQLFIFTQFLSAQPDRHAVVRIGIDPPVQITTPTLPSVISPKGVQAFATMKLKRLPFALTFEDAVRRLNERRKLFEEKFLGSASTGEPTRTVRRIKE